jgi:hypothetical protein
MKASIHHNLSPEELTKALARLADASGIGPDVAGQLLKACACDDEPKEPREPAVAGLFYQFQQRYREAMDDLRQIVGTGRHLRKSVILTASQIRDVLQTIKDRFDFMAGQMQTDYQPDDPTLQRWKDMGLCPPETTPLNFAEIVAGPDAYLIRNAFIFGRLWDAVERGETYHDVLRLSKEMPLLKPDLDAIAVAERETGLYIQNFGNDIATEVGQKWAQRQADTVRQMAVDYHQRTLTRRVLDREEKQELGEEILDLPITNWQQLSSELYHAMDDKARDWQRVAFFEINSATKQGHAHELMRIIGPDALVFRRPLPTACAQCKHLLLEADGQTPRLFRLKDLILNGNNIGRKPMPTRSGKVHSTERPDGQETLKATAGPLHPWCGCSPVREYIAGAHGWEPTQPVTT